eukprot:Awhi_evm1s15627
MTLTLITSATNKNKSSLKNEASNSPSLQKDNETNDANQSTITETEISENHENTIILPKLAKYARNISPFEAVVMALAGIILLVLLYVGTFGSEAFIKAGGVWIILQVLMVLYIVQGVVMLAAVVLDRWGGAPKCTIRFLPSFSLSKGKVTQAPISKFDSNIEAGKETESNLSTSSTSTVHEHNQIYLSTILLWLALTCIVASYVLTVIGLIKSDGYQNLLIAEIVMIIERVHLMFVIFAYLYYHESIIHFEKK